MAGLVSIAAVGVMGLSAYGVWRHTQNVEAEDPQTLAPAQEVSGRRSVITTFGNNHGLIDKLIGTEALQFLATSGWAKMETSDSTDVLPYAGIPGGITKAALSRKKYLEVMGDVNTNAESQGIKPLFDFDKPLPPLLGLEESPEPATE